MEVQRISSITPVVVPHCALRDTKLAGYSIPKVTFWPDSNFQYWHSFTMIIKIILFTAGYDGADPHRFRAQ